MMVRIPKEYTRDQIDISLIEYWQRIYLSQNLPEHHRLREVMVCAFAIKALIKKRDIQL